MCILAFNWHQFLSSNEQLFLAINEMKWETLLGLSRTKYLRIYNVCTCNFYLYMYISFDIGCQCILQKKNLLLLSHGQAQYVPMYMQSGQR
jgi:hypothetical protein